MATAAIRRRRREKTAAARGASTPMAMAIRSGREGMRNRFSGWERATPMLGPTTASRASGTRGSRRGARLAATIASGIRASQVSRVRLSTVRFQPSGTPRRFSTASVM